MFESDKRAYLHAMTKLLAFVLPKGSVHTIEQGAANKKPSWFDDLNVPFTFIIMFALSNFTQ